LLHVAAWIGLFKPLPGLWLISLLIMSIAAVPSAAAPRAAQVFLLRDVDADGRDRLLFIDLLTGSQTAREVDGDRYTVLPENVLYFDRVERRVMLAFADGTTQPHPFIQPRGDVRRIDWVLSADRSWIAWTAASGGADSLSTVTEVARLDGSERRLAFAENARQGIRAFPVAFSADAGRLIMDYQPDTLGDLTPFRQYAGLFAVDLATGAAEPLPDEPGCFCGGSVRGRAFVRMALAGDRPGYELRVYDLQSGARRVIPPAGSTTPSLDAYTQGGDLLISPDGTQAIYALAQVRGFGTAAQSIQAVFMLVDLTTLTQRPLTDPISALIRPTAWTEDGSAVLFTNPTGNGTWRLDIAENRLNLIAEAVYLGRV
jgi:hypothetical protein